MLMNCFPIVLALLLSLFVQKCYLGTVNGNDKMTTDKSIETITYLIPACGTCSGGICKASVPLFYGAVVLAIMCTVHFTFVGRESAF
uniref:Secreted protein n=1 Tax=Globodera pallida TaxID=36090 RepID=A0A183CJK8_GLOPA